MPSILSANTLSSGFDVANSCRFNDGDSAYMHKTPGGAGTSADLFTFSMWIKRGIISSSDRIVLFDAREDAENFDRISFTSDDTLEWKGIRSDSQTHNLTTSQVFRDPSAWMHLHFIWDSADGTADNRMRIYVNGTQVTAFGTRANPTSGLDAIIGAAQKHSVGSTASSGTYYDGYMAEVVYLDGQELTPDGNTGEFDEDSGIWKPKKVSGLTFGTNGFYLNFQASGNLGNDANGGTDLTEVNLAATDQSTDTCTNNFATMNSLVAGTGATFAEGNLAVGCGTNATYGYSASTIGVDKGKWYLECKVSSSPKAVIGIIFDGDSGNVFNEIRNNRHAGNNDTGWGYKPGNSGAVEHNGANISYSTATADENDVIGVALDLDNDRLYFSKNGTFLNSGNTQNSTGAIDISSRSGNVFISIGDSDSSSSTTTTFNFGSSPYAISSGNADADGHGNFEHAVPSGYFALNTKNLAEYGG